MAHQCSFHLLCHHELRETWESPSLQVHSLNNPAYMESCTLLDAHWKSQVLSQLATSALGIPELFFPMLSRNNTSASLQSDANPPKRTPLHPQVSPGPPTREWGSKLRQTAPTLTYLASNPAVPPHPEGVHSFK